MAFLTEDRARAASGLRGTLAEAELRKSAATSSTTEFDVFLSHARLDAEVIAGVKRLLEGRRLSVYIDWIEDPQLDRTRVTPKTADQLRMRMRHCKSLIFATSNSSPSSKWMPWELGYFDGFKPGHVAVLPLVEAGKGFTGQEYLGLYPTLEDVASLAHNPILAIRTTAEDHPVERLITSSFTIAA
jgi:hypothetical protein